MQSRITLLPSAARRRDADESHGVAVTRVFLFAMSRKTKYERNMDGEVNAVTSPPCQAGDRLTTASDALSFTHPKPNKHKAQMDKHSNISLSLSLCVSLSQTNGGACGFNYESVTRLTKRHRTGRHFTALRTPNRRGYPLHSAAPSLSSSYQSAHAAHTISNALGILPPAPRGSPEDVTSSGCALTVVLASCTKRQIVLAAAAIVGGPALVPRA